LRSERTLFEKVVAILSPYLGEMTSRASIKMFLLEFEVTPETFGPEHVSGLAEKLKPGLKVFVGNTKADVLTQQVLLLNKQGRPSP
jgi:hypothetical protein